MADIDIKKKFFYIFLSQKKERYGWDQYKEEGLAELKKIKKSKLFSGKDKFQGLLDRYINLYSKKRKYSEQITGKV